MAGGQILAFPIDIDRRPYNTLALPCECVIIITVMNNSNIQHLMRHILAKKRRIMGSMSNNINCAITHCFLVRQAVCYITCFCARMCLLGSRSR